MNYYNTTTEPTPDPNSPLHFWALFVNVIGFFSITAVMTESVLRWIKYRDFGVTRKLDCDDDSDDEEEEKKYTDNYMKEFEDLKERELDEVDFLNFNTCYTKEETPGGLVIMSYNKETECFSYYTDNLKEITYDILETVARKFVVENDCKTIYTICKSKEEKTETKRSSTYESECNPEFEEVEEVEEVEEKQQQPSVFAKFKKYNTGGKGSVPNFKSVINVIEQTNHFRFNGKIYDYEEIVKQNEREQNARETTKNIDYASYKKQLLENNKKDD